MKQTLFFLMLFTWFLFAINTTKANLISASSENYTSYLYTRVEGDTLYLAPGNYTNNLTLKNLNGTSDKPIVITGNGNGTVFQGQSCCNTISITQCSYLIIKSLKLDGLNQEVDAVKAEGTAGNWAHHITLEHLNIVNYGASQQNVGISTKCSAWDWIIRKNIIIGAGTGMYLGNSDGSKPFVNGVIEYNYVANTVGYNIEIKHQLNGVRDDFAGTALNGKTIIRHNVFTKNESSSTGGSARPNLLVGGFPLTGWGSNDYYEIYGNFFYNNPVEALFQGTGNLMLYNNIFVNHFNPSGFRAVYITPQNGVNPQDVKVFHNTIWAKNSSGGIRLYNHNPNYHQYCYGNAVFSPLPITNFSDTLHNITDSYSNAKNYILSADTDISKLDLYPLSGILTGTITPNKLFTNITLWDKDFNGDSYDWSYRGAYSGSSINRGWHLQLDTMPTQSEPISSVNSLFHQSNIEIYPNPVRTTLYVDINDIIPVEIDIYNLLGEKVISSGLIVSQISIDFSEKPNGIYIMIIKKKEIVNTKKIIKVED
ncbi:MAG: T9SS type A sorting domain-containing protein [Bacteroidota bacterium]